MNTDGGKPFIIPVFLPHLGCPHQCAFCDQQAITSVRQKSPSPGDIRNLINRFLRYKGQRRSTAQVAFFGGNFLGLTPARIHSFLAVADRFVQDGKIDGIRFSTRPDTIDDERLDLLEGHQVATVELGAQSMDDRVLALSMRGHTAADTVSAVGFLKKNGYEIGLQMMVGLPGDDKDRLYATGRKIVNLKPDFVRIYPTAVLKNSRLAEWYQSGKYRPPTLEKSITLVKQLFLYFRKHDISVIRMGLQAFENSAKNGSIMAGPYHPAFGHLVHSELFLDMARLLLREKGHHRDAVTLRVHPRSISKIRGLKNSNVDALQKEFDLRTVRVIPGPLLPKEGLQIAESGPVVTYSNLDCDL